MTGEEKLCRILSSQVTADARDGTFMRRIPECGIVAQGMGLPAAFAVRFARGAARYRPWCEVDHRQIDWDTPLPSRREFEIVIMVEVLIG